MSLARPVAAARRRRRRTTCGRSSTITLDVAVQVPVEADASSPARGTRKVRMLANTGERIVVEVDLVVAAGDLERAPAALDRARRATRGISALVRGVLAGERDAERATCQASLSQVVLVDGCRAAVTSRCDSCSDTTYSPSRPNGPAVPVGLRRPADAIAFAATATKPPCRAAVGEEVRLAAAMRNDRGRLLVDLAPAARDAEAEAVEPLRCRAVRNGCTKRRPTTSLPSSVSTSCVPPSRTPLKPPTW